jgi:hypothetical protein
MTDHTALRLLILRSKSIQDYLRFSSDKEEFYTRLSKVAAENRLAFDRESAENELAATVMSEQAISSGLLNNRNNNCFNT